VLSVEDGVAGFRSPHPVQGYVILDKGANAAAIQQRIEALLKDNPEVRVRNQSDSCSRQPARSTRSR
jgi:hypothetical protein